MTTAVRIRLERPEDHATSVEIERAAFGSDEEADIVVAVRGEIGSFALVAAEGGLLVGHVQLSRAWVGTDPVLALGPIGVLPDRRGRGIGRALLEGATDEALRRNEMAIVLLGDPRLYRRFGYRARRRAPDFGIRTPACARDGFVIEEEHFMILPLDERADVLGGEVRWHPAFGDTGTV